MTRINRSLIETLAAVGLSIALLGSPALASPQDRAAAQVMDLQLERRLALAEGHHDLAVLYIKKGDLERGLAQAHEILQLHMGGDFEKLWVQSLSIICEKLAEVKRFDIGQSLLDEAMKLTELSPNRVKVLRNKARLYMLAGDNDKAIESWNRALEIEGGRGR